MRVIKIEDGKPFLVLSMDDDGAQRVFIDLDHGPRDPRLIGIALAEVVAGIAESLLDSGLTKNDRLMTIEEIRAEMKDLFDREWVRPTSSCEVKRLS